MRLSLFLKSWMIRIAYNCYLLVTSQRMRKMACSLCIKNEFDRMIMDARRPNLKEWTPKKWTFYMASSTSLLHICLLTYQSLAFCCDDLCDYYYYYYQLLVSNEMVRRNAFRGHWPPSRFKHFKCFTPLYSSSTTTFTSYPLLGYYGHGTQWGSGDGTMCTYVGIT